MTRHYKFVDYATQGYNVLVAALILLFHNHTTPNWGGLLAVHAALFLMIHGLLARAAARPSQKFLDFLRQFYPVLLYTFFFAETGWINRMFFPEYLDPVAIRWDQALFGFQPAARFMDALPWLPLSELFYAAYFSYYFMVAGVGLALLYRNRRQFSHFVSLVSFVFYLCYLAYIAVPIIGPRVLYHEIPGYEAPAPLQALVPQDSFPPGPQAGPFFQIVSFLYRVFEAPGAAFPSSHVAIAWCTVYFSFLYLPRIRWPHAVLALLLTFATVYCRYHYAVDALAGLATALLLIPLGNRLYFHFEPRPAPVRREAPIIPA